MQTINLNQSTNCVCSFPSDKLSNEKTKGEKKASWLCFHKLGCRVNFTTQLSRCNTFFCLIFAGIYFALNCRYPSGGEARLWKHWGKLSVCHSEANWSDLLVRGISPKLTPPPPTPPKGKKQNNKHCPLRIFLLMRKSILPTATAAAASLVSSAVALLQLLPSGLLLWFFSHPLASFSYFSSFRKEADCL